MTDIREQAITAIAQAFGPCSDGCGTDCSCREHYGIAYDAMNQIVRAKVEERFSGWLSPEEVEGQMELVRADERERYAAAIKAIPLPLETTILANLRAKVIALAEEMDSADPWWREHAQTFDAVLALLEEES